MMFGWMFTAHQLGASTIALLAGMIRTSVGTYDSAFVMSGVLCMIAAVMVLFVGRTNSAQSVAPVPA
jgi:sugar phosphate permease